MRLQNENRYCLLFVAETSEYHNRRVFLHPTSRHLRDGIGVADLAGTFQIFCFCNLAIGRRLIPEADHQALRLRPQRTSNHRPAVVFFGTVTHCLVYSFPRVPLEHGILATIEDSEALQLLERGR